MPVGKKGSARWWPRDVRVEPERWREECPLNPPKADIHALPTTGVLWRIGQNKLKKVVRQGSSARVMAFGAKPKRYSFAVPAGTSSLFGSARIVLSEPFGADCIPGGVSPWGLDAGAPPPDPVLIGPVFPCGCVTLPPELALVGGSLGFDWEKAADAADKAKAVVRAISLRHMSHL